MKYHFYITSIVLFVIIISNSSCSKSNEAGRYIPSSAQAAIQIDLKSLSAKLPWSEIKNNPLFTNAHNTDTNWVKNLLDSPAVSGIDIDKAIAIFVQKETNGGYVAVEGNIKDVNAFKILCSRLGTVTENDGVSYASRFPVCVGWNNSHFIYIMNAPAMQSMDELHRRMKNDSIDITDHKQRDLMVDCRNLFSLEEKKSLAVDEKFSSLLKEKGDVHVWINSADFYKDLQLPGALALVNLEKLYNESVSTATINFDNGSIKINAHTYSNAALANIYEKFSGGKIDEQMLKRIPGNDVAAAFAIHFKPEALLEIAKVINLDGIINGAEPLIGFNANDFIKANKGDIVFGVSDFKMANDSIVPDETSLPFAVTKPAFNIVFGVAVADSSAFNKLIYSGKKLGSGFINKEEIPVAYSYNGNYFSLSNIQANADAFINSPKSINREFINKINGSPLAGYLNLQSLIKGFENMAAKDSSTKAIYDASLKIWDNALLKGGNFSNGALNFDIEINLLDKNSNSLKQLNSYFSLLGGIMNNQHKKEMEDMRAMEDAIPSEVEPKVK